MNSLQHRVLVVDDNEDFAAVLAGLLELQSFEVATAANGAEAVERAKSFQPHVVVSDLNMPVMNGYDAGRLLKQNTPRVRMVAVTGEHGSSARERATNCGFEAFMSKPPDVEELIRLVRWLADEPLPPNGQV